MPIGTTNAKEYEKNYLTRNIKQKISERNKKTQNAMRKKNNINRITATKLKEIDFLLP